MTLTLFAVIFLLAIIAFIIAAIVPVHALRAIAIGLALCALAWMLTAAGYHP